jgi:hypothetical protein
LALGATVEELQARMTAREFTDWAHYYALEPWGQERDNWHAAVIASAVVRAMGGKVDPAKLMYRGNARRQSVEQMRAVMMQATRDMSGHDYQRR